MVVLGSNQTHWAEFYNDSCLAGHTTGLQGGLVAFQSFGRQKRDWETIHETLYCTV